MGDAINVAPPAVTVYSTGDACKQCEYTCLRLEQLGIPFQIIDLTDETNRQRLVYVTETLGHSQAPVVIVDGRPEHHWTGFRPDLIDRLAASISDTSVPA